MSKLTFKKLVTKYITYKIHNELLESVKSYKQLNYTDLSKEEFKRKKYFSSLDLESGRMAFRVASKMIMVPANFSSLYRRRGLSLTYPSCMGMSRTETGRAEQNLNPPTLQPLLSQSHLLNDCVAVSDIRAKCRLDDEDLIALFFLKVMSRNLEIEPNDNYH